MAGLTGYGRVQTQGWMRGAFPNRWEDFGGRSRHRLIAHCPASAAQREARDGASTIPRFDTSIASTQSHIANGALLFCTANASSLRSETWTIGADIPSATTDKACAGRKSSEPTKSGLEAQGSGLGNNNDPTLSTTPG
ncbi:hypothetical protein HBI23_257450 [Parastagonospora nodorum]|nr:hypothetical protein HBI23_257450 [Parastagonospora nodorum]KAH5621700.1 hypothetical protein HBI51_249140 [Parastagonospora nodorum]KAH5983395.1 hypothetical protein HBI84_247760 [Parastagonospora nodorum]KAH6132282.1 hypothetical protein HBI68_255760 [Parastagonospora nodorum]KAH6383620.1 hypothetical protein HBI60_256030 [Parastagonospora nodorum]